MPQIRKHRLGAFKIPIELNAEFEASRIALGHTPTKAMEEAVRLYVKASRRKKRITDVPPSDQ